MLLSVQVDSVQLIRGQDQVFQSILGNQAVLSKHQPAIIALFAQTTASNKLFEIRVKIYEISFSNGHYRFKGTCDNHYNIHGTYTPKGLGSFTESK